MFNKVYKYTNDYIKAPSFWDITTFDIIEVGKDGDEFKTFNDPHSIRFKILNEDLPSTGYCPSEKNNLVVVFAYDEKDPGNNCKTVIEKLLFLECCEEV